MFTGSMFLGSSGDQADVEVDLSVASYDEKSLYIGANETVPDGLDISEDNTKLYVSGSGSDEGLQYDLATPKELNTATLGASFNFGTEASESWLRNVKFDKFGTAAYMTGNNTKAIRQYTATGGDMGSLVYASKFIDITPQASNTEQCFISHDRTKAFFLDIVSTAKIYQYGLSTPGDLSTKTYEKAYTIQENNPTSFWISKSGLKLLIIDGDTKKVKQYSIANANDLVQIEVTYDSVEFYVGGQDSYPESICCTSDNRKMYIGGNGNNRIYQYSLV